MCMCCVPCMNVVYQYKWTPTLWSVYTAHYNYRLYNRSSALIAIRIFYPYNIRNGKLKKTAHRNSKRKGAYDNSKLVCE